MRPDEAARIAEALNLNREEFTPAEIAADARRSAVDAAETALRLTAGLGLRRLADRLDRIPLDRLDAIEARQAISDRLDDVIDRIEGRR